MKKALIRKFTPMEAIWLACAVDGEGSFGLYNYIGDGRRILIQIGNTSKAFVKEFRRIIGSGSTVYRHTFEKSHKGRKPMYHFTLKGTARCYDVLKQIEPYLIIKKSRARKIMKEVERKPFGRWQQFSIATRKAK